MIIIAKLLMKKMIAQELLIKETNLHAPYLNVVKSLNFTAQTRALWR